MPYYLMKSDPIPSTLGKRMKYYLFKTCRYGNKEEYYTGNKDLDNKPNATKDLKLAAPFSTARSAYDYGGLNKMNWWKVGKR